MEKRVFNKILKYLTHNDLGMSSKRDIRPKTGNFGVRL
jgi:hypothetical protein